MKQPIHLAIVTPFPPTSNGIGWYGYYLARALVRSGAFSRITVLTESAPNTRLVEQRAGVRIERLWRRDGLDASWKITARLRQLQPDLVWYNLGASMFGRSPLSNLAGLVSPALGRLAGLPSIVTAHEMAEQADLRALGVPGGRLATYGARLIMRLSTQADVVCVTLRRHAEWLAARYTDTHLLHIPLGVFHTPRLLPVSDDSELLIFANFAPFKGLELLLAVFHDLYARYPVLRLTVAGAEHPRFPGYLESVRHAFGEHTAVRWLGYVTEPRMRQIFRGATIVVLPCTATTGASSVLYRAAAWGRPIVASNLPELRASVEEECLQVEFFMCGDSNNLAATLERLLAEPALRAAQVLHNYHTITRRLTLMDTCQAYLRAFDLALAAHNRDIRLSIPLSLTSETS